MKRGKCSKTPFSRPRGENPEVYLLPSGDPEGTVKFPVDVAVDIAHILE